MERLLRSTEEDVKKGAKAVQDGVVGERSGETLPSKMDTKKKIRGSLREV